MTKAEKKNMLTKIDIVKTELQAKRRQIRDMVDELNSYDDTCEEAVEALDQAADALSKYL